jgi:hypothetical protein
MLNVLRKVTRVSGESKGGEMRDQEGDEFKNCWSTL